MKWRTIEYCTMKWRTIKWFTIMWCAIRWRTIESRTIHAGAARNPTQVAVDTGTSLLAGPTEIMEALDEKLGVKSDCSNMGSLPMLGFSLNGQVRAEGNRQLRVVGAVVARRVDGVVRRRRGGHKITSMAWGWASGFHGVRVVGVAPGPRLLEDALVPEVVARVLQAGDVGDAAPRAGGEASLLNSLSSAVVGAGAGECRPYVFAGPLRAWAPQVSVRGEYVECQVQAGWAAYVAAHRCRACVGTAAAVTPGVLRPRGCCFEGPGQLLRLLARRLMSCCFAV